MANRKHAGLLERALREFRWSFVVTALAFILLGLVLIIWPDASMNVLCYLVGTALVLYGGFNVLSFVFSPERAFTFELVIGVITAAIGIFALFSPSSIRDILSVILGLIVVIDSLIGIKRAFTLRELGLQSWWVLLLLSVIAAFLGVLSFAVLFHAPRRSYLACAVCGAVAWGCYLLAAPLGLFLATTLAAIALTLLSRMLSIAMKMPSTVFIVTGIFPLVPGAGIYHTAYALVSRNMEAFTLRGMQTLALAGAIALGILIGMGFPKLLVELGGHALEKLPLCHREARP